MITVIRLVAGLVGLALLGSSALSASAFTEPGITGRVSDLANCPADVIVLVRSSECVHSYTKGGSVQIGHATMPIKVPGDTFDLGLAEYQSVCGVILRETTGCTVAPLHGLLNGPAQPVPGGLLGTVGSVPLTGVSAKLEWATIVPPGTVFGSAGDCSSGTFVTFNQCRFLNSKSGTASTLAVKIHLMSPFLGANCYIGSATSPITIALTTGITNPPSPALPLHGKPYESLHVGSVLSLTGATLVNNSFSVPVAYGCGTTSGGLVDAAINRKLGLPSPPGHNAIVINADIEVLTARATIEGGWVHE